MSKLLGSSNEDLTFEVFVKSSILTFSIWNPTPSEQVYSNILDWIRCEVAGILNPNFADLVLKKVDEHKVLGWSVQRFDDFE